VVVGRLEVQVRRTGDFAEPEEGVRERAVWILAQVVAPFAVIEQAQPLLQGVGRPWGMRASLAAI
jgi:hypothetical protein